MGRNPFNNDCLDEYCSIPNNLIITYHKYIGENNWKWTKEKIELYDENDNPRWHEHPVFKNQVDVVAIPFDLNANILSYNEGFNIDSNYNLNITDTIYAIGFPYGYFVKSKEEPHGVWTAGRVATDPCLDININNKELPVFLMDSRTRKGQSGSPVLYFSKDGWEVTPNGCLCMCAAPIFKEVGIYSGRMNKDSDLGYVWKWEVIKEILSGINNKK